MPFTVRNDWSGQTLPHPPGRRRFLGDTEGLDGRAALQSVMRRTADLGPLFETRVFGQKFVWVASAELCAELCDESRFQKALPPALVALREFAGDGLFTAYNHERNWQLAHDLLLPAFSKASMHRYHGVMLEVVRELFAVLPAGRPVEVAPLMTKLTMETIGRAAFSRDFGSFADSEPHPFVPAMVAALTSSRQSAILATLPGSGLLRRRLRRHNAGHLDYIGSMVDELVSERRARLAAGDEDGDDLLKIMLSHPHPDTGERLDDRTIRYEILTFLVAGHETTSGALSFALHHLARDPKVLRAAQEEVDAVLGEGGEPTFEQVPRLRHLRRVVDETLRLWPTAPAFARSPRQTTTLEGWTMRPEDWAIVLLPRVHRDPAVWGEDAELFDPDRFLPERGRGRLPHSYKPFGTGERACIGRQFALHEAVLVLARIVHRFDLEPDPAYDLRIDERLTFMPAGLHLAFHPRKVSRVVV